MSGLPVQKAGECAVGGEMDSEETRSGYREALGVERVTVSHSKVSETMPHTVPTS
jgi:hypothetical protein